MKSSPIFAAAAFPRSQKYSVQVVAAKADAPAEILVHGPIGRSWWSDEGIAASDFINELAKIPKGQKVIVGINSQGGSVGEGLAIYNAIAQRAADVTARIDGYAVSIASVIPLAASKVISPKSSVWMIHDPWSMTQGNADDHRASADMLDTHADVLVSTYETKTKKSKDEIRTAMKAETWLSGEEAVAWGLADEASDEPVALNEFDFSPFARTPNNLKEFVQNANRKAGTVLSFNPTVAQVAPATITNKDTMKEKLIAMLTELGVKVAADATEDQLLALLKTHAAKPETKPTPSEGTLTKAELTSAIAAMERKAEVKAELAKLVAEKRITQAQADKALPAALKDDSVLAMLRENPVMPEVAAEVSGQAEIVGESARDIEKCVLGMRAPILAAIEKRTEDPDVKAISRNAQEIARAISKNLGKLLPVMNTNNISSDLKRNVMLSQALRAFKRRIVGLSAFSTIFNNVPLLGTNKIAVPYYPLHTTTSNTFVDGTGYEFNHDSDTEDKDVTIDTRKYQPFKFYSHQLARQPFFNTQRILEIAAEQLSVEVFEDVMSLFTLAAYGAAAKSEPAASFDSDDVADIAGVCDDADWPLVGRSLILDTDYITALRKDPALKNADKAGSAETLREGVISRLYEFDVIGCPRVPSNSQNLVGMAVLPQAALVATSPIMPGPGVRHQLINYDVVTDPDTGISFEYRYWGDADQDEEREVVEVNYGKAAGQAEAGKRITSE